MSKVFWESFMYGLSLRWAWDGVLSSICFFRKHKWRRPKGNPMKICRVCGKAVEIRRRKVASEKEAV